MGGRSLRCEAFSLQFGHGRRGRHTYPVSTDHVIESFRNGLWPGYKTSEGIEPDLLAQFPLLEKVLSASGIVVWPMVEFEADDAPAAAATAAARDARLEQVIVCTSDKDLAQWVSGTRVVQLNRRTRADPLPNRQRPTVLLLCSDLSPACLLGCRDPSPPR